MAGLAVVVVVRTILEQVALVPKTKDMLAVMDKISLMLQQAVVVLVLLVRTPKVNLQLALAVLE
jgi:hypothetical protein